MPLSLQVWLESYCEITEKADMSIETDGFIPKHGGHGNLLVFQQTRIIYDTTLHFCDKSTECGSRARDQMVQVARSGIQNLLEGCQASGRVPEFAGTCHLDVRDRRPNKDGTKGRSAHSGSRQALRNSNQVERLRFSGRDWELYGEFSSGTHGSRPDLHPLCDRQGHINRFHDRIAGTRVP